MEKLTGVLLVAVTQMALYGIIFAVGVQSQFQRYGKSLKRSVLDGILWIVFSDHSYGTLYYLCSFWDLESTPC